MLVLTRKAEQTIIVDDRITITILQIQGNQVRIAIDAPKEVGIRRAELSARLPKSEPKEKAKPASPPPAGERNGIHLSGTLRTVLARSVLSPDHLNNDLASPRSRIKVHQNDLLPCS